MKRVLFVFLAVLLFSLLQACTTGGTPRTTPAPALPGGSSVSAPGSTVGGWEKEWEQTLAPAKKEGRLVVYFTAGPEVRNPLTKAFQDKYGIAIEALGGSGREIGEKILRERKAGLFLADIYQGGATTPLSILKPNGVLDPLEPAFIIPDLKDPEAIKKVWWEGKLTWFDPDHKVFAFLAYPRPWAVINTNLVKPEELKSFKDLLNPKWKGKIIMSDPVSPGPGGKFFSVTASFIMNMDFFRDLAKQDPVISRDGRLVVDGLAKEKYAISLAPLSEIVAEYKRAGAPLIHLQPVEGASLATGHGGLALINNAPHPNASKIFINWLLSKEGITLFSKSNDVHSLREDVSTDFLSAEGVRQPGLRYYWTDQEEFLLKETTLYAQGREIFGIR